MIGDEIKQTRCTACEAEHVYKHAKVPRQRRKTETPAALYAQVLAGGPKKVTHEIPAAPGAGPAEPAPIAAAPNDDAATETAATAEPPAITDDIDRTEDGADEEGPVHRPLIRASLPKIDGQQPPARPIPEFTVRQPGGRHNRFRPRHQRGGGQQGQYGQRFTGDRSSGNSFGPPRGDGGMRQGGGRPPQGHTSSRPPRHRGGGGGQKRSK